MTDIGRRDGIDPAVANSFHAEHWADRRQFTCNATAIAMGVVVWAIAGLAVVAIVAR